MIGMLTIVFLTGSGFFAASRWAKRVRNRGPQATAPVPATIVPAGQVVALPGAAPDDMSPADRMIQNWKAKQPTVSPATFGRR